MFTGGINRGQPYPWARTTINACGNMQDVYPPNDIQICNGRMYEASNDNPTGIFDAGSVLSLAMYPKQPFDFAGRTGTVAFDVTNDTEGTHAAWPEFWMTDMPVPNPFSHFGSWQSQPQNGFALRFGVQCQPGNACVCPNGSDPGWQWSLDSATIIRDWVVEGDVDCDAANPNCIQNGQTKVTILACVRQPDPTLGPNGGMNHVEIKVSQNQIDVYATHAGTTSPLIQIAKIERANLTLSRGFVWIEDVHYNADKADLDPKYGRGTGDQKIHTFSWDNIAFDGPVLARDLSFDVNDRLTTIVGNDSLPNSVYLGWETNKGDSGIILNSLPIPNQAAIDNATNAFLLFNFMPVFGPNPKVFTYYINGTMNTFNWPYPDDEVTGRTIAMPIPKAQLKVGVNTVSIKADEYLQYANVDINLASARGIVYPTISRNASALNVMNGHLVDGNGFALYTTAAACTGGCLTAWPPLNASTKPTALGGLSSANIAISNGQVTYKGKPLYYFVSDQSPPQATGNNVNGFIFATP